MPTIDFWLTSLIVVLIPGTGVIYTVSTGLFRGRRASIAAAAGCTAGIIPHLSASIIGLVALLHMSAVAFQTIKYAGVAYLLYLAWGMWRDTGAIALTSPVSGKKLRQIAWRGFLINILNPKLSIFFLAFLPLFIVPSGVSPTLQLLLLSLAFMTMTFVIFVLYGSVAHALSRRLTGSAARVIGVRRSFAALFAAFGIKLALTDR